MRKILISTAIALLMVLSFGSAFAASDLENRVAVLETTVTSQQMTIQSLQASLEAAIAALESRVDVVEDSPAVQIGTLGYMKLDANERNGVIGPHVIFEGVNLHLQNGAGESINQGEDLPNGLGNLIVGYDEIDTHPNEELNPGDRNGSHNLVIGWGNKFPNISGIVHGYRNVNNGRFSATISGVKNNVGDYSSIIGGFKNTLLGESNVIVGGSQNLIEESWRSVLIGGSNNYMPWGSSASVIAGGQNNITYGNFSTITGGQDNIAYGNWSHVSGGQNNNASGNWSSVSGGFQRGSGGEHDWLAGSLWEDQ